MEHRLTEYLTVTESDGNRVVGCRKCQYIFGPLTENPKAGAAVKEFPMVKKGTLFRESKRFVLREFYCPGCGTMFDVEVSLKNSPYVWDAQLKGFA